MLGRITLWLWLAAVASAYMAIGQFASRMTEGIDGMLLSRWRVVLALSLISAACLATVAWTFTRVRQLRAASPVGTDRGRRGFLTGAAFLGGGLAATGLAAYARLHGWITVTSPIMQSKVEAISPEPKSSWAGARVQNYRRLGRTEARVSDISLGSANLTEEAGGEALAREAIARGINYFDTSPDYAGASSERALGLAMAGQREKIFLATKFCTPYGHLPAGSSVAEYVASIEASLERLQTTYVDLVHVHACNETRRLDDPNLHEAVRQLREAGKMRFLGVSTHTPNLEKVADFAIADGRFDVLMLAYHHGSFPKLPEIIARAHAADLGVVAMKTLKGAKHKGLADFRDAADSYAQAAFKWVLSNPDVSCLVISFWEPAQLDEYLFASGQTPTSGDYTVLRRYDELIAGKHCFAHCGACLDTCPEELAINDVLRHRMYFEDYGQQKTAMSLYAKLEKQADVCIGCAAPCLGACPHGVPIQERTIGEHRLLTIV
jgi:hypothetical protein